LKVVHDSSTTKASGSIIEKSEVIYMMEHLDSIPLTLLAIPLKPPPAPEPALSLAEESDVGSCAHIARDKFE
jgi:hypothetical protein